MTISRFFAPRKSNLSKELIDRKVVVGEDGWEKPIGLTKKHAIALDDSSSDENNEREQQTQFSVGTEIESKPTSNVVNAKLSDVGDINLNLSENENIETTPKISADKNVDSELFISNMNVACGPKIGREIEGQKSLSKDESVETEEGKEKDGNKKSQANPFLQFARDIGECESSYFTSLTTTPSISADSIITKRGNKNLSKSSSQKGTKRNNTEETSCPSHTKRDKMREKKRKRMAKVIDEMEYSEMTQEQLAKCKTKWQSFADDSAPVEIKRFQVLIAARLHCQAHESTVRKAMVELRHLFSEQDSSGGNANNPHYLCPNSLATASPEEISKIISSVLFANVKSKQIIQAAIEIKTQFHGKVPETMRGMQMVTGIGPKLAKLLYHVNSVEAYENTLLITKELI